MAQKADVVFRKKAQVVDAVAQHGNPLDTHAKGKAGKLFRVDPYISQHIGVHHARAGNFYPAGVFAHVTAFALADEAGDIDLRAGFGEGKERRPQPDFGIRPEHFFRKVVEGLFEVGKAHVSVNVQAFHLVKEAMRPGGDGFVAIDASGHDGPNGRLLFFEQPDLHVAGVGAQQHVWVTFYKKCVLHFAGRVIGREVEGGEIMPIVFYFRPIGHVKTQSFEDLDNAIAGLVKRVQVADFVGDNGQGEVERWISATPGCLQAGGGLFEFGFGQLLELVQRFAEGFFFFGGYGFEMVEQRGNRAVAGKECKPETLHRLRGVGNKTFHFPFYFFNSFSHSFFRLDIK